MPIFHVLLTRTGPAYRADRALEEQSGWEDHAAFMDELVARGVIVLGGPLSDDRRVVLVVSACSVGDVREQLSRDPWHPSHLTIDDVSAWHVRLNGTGGPL